MAVAEYIAKQESPRKEILSSIHKMITMADKNVKPKVGKMMGKEMIIYDCDGMMKYALSNVKAHISLHVLPMYGSVKIHTTYKKLLSKAKFQKGCINFTAAEEMPLSIVQDLIRDCSKIDLRALFQKPAAKKRASKKWIDYHKNKKKTIKK